MNISRLAYFLWEKAGNIVRTSTRDYFIALFWRNTIVVKHLLENCLRYRRFDDKNRCISLLNVAMDILFILFSKEI